MRQKLLILLFSTALIATFPKLSAAQATQKQATVNISGELTNPFELTTTILHQFPQTEVTRKDRDGAAHTYSGVTLQEILQKAGTTMGPQLKGENLSKYLWVEASDGYQIVFALAELDKSFTDRVIILADTVDGKPLPPADGPFRIIVQDEKKPARCIKQVTSLKVAFAK